MFFQEGSGTLDKSVARCIVDYMDNKVAPLIDPRTLGKSLTGPLEPLWRYRIGDYRVLCEIRNLQLEVLVVRIGHRSQIY